MKLQTPDVAQAARVLRLSKNGHEFVVRYEVGDEPTVLLSLTDMVRRRDVPFDWFDAAVMSHQLGEHLAQDLKHLMPKQAA